MNRLQGKVVLITGAARGIGAAAAIALSEEGATVVICDILDSKGSELAEAIRARGAQAIYVHLDVTREEDWAAAVREATSSFGGVDVLVNNAAIFIGKGVEEASMDEWHQMCDINLTGVLLGIRAVLPSLRERALSDEHGTSIVNISSTAGLVGSAADPLYSLTKGGIALLTKALAIDFGQRGYRVRVNSIHPGSVETEMGAQALTARAEKMAAGDVGAIRTKMIQAHPIGRLGRPDDIAKAILYMSSNESSFVTGASLAVDGGYTAQ